MDFAIVVHRTGKAGKLAAEVFDDGGEALAAFGKIKSGKVGFVRLRWADMDKRVDHGIEHEGPTVAAPNGELLVEQTTLQTQGAKTKEDLEAQTIAELKAECERQNIETTGFKLKQDYLDALTEKSA
jgi:hypothetical protein